MAQRKWCEEYHSVVWALMASGTGIHFHPHLHLTSTASPQPRRMPLPSPLHGLHYLKQDMQRLTTLKCTTSSWTSSCVA
ncbi:hypothetical protein SRHO_G00014260 [Serrasalmus rhombeus]